MAGETSPIVSHPNPGRLSSSTASGLGTNIGNNGSEMIQRHQIEEGRNATRTPSNPSDTMVAPSRSVVAAATNTKPVAGRKIIA
jgi:LysM repeat protein